MSTPPNIFKKPDSLSLQLAATTQPTQPTTIPMGFGDAASRNITLPEMRMVGGDYSKSMNNFHSEFVKKYGEKPQLQLPEGYERYGFEGQVRGPDGKIYSGAPLGTGGRSSSAIPGLEEIPGYSELNKDYTAWQTNYDKNRRTASQLAQTHTIPIQQNTGQNIMPNEMPKNPTGGPGTAPNIDVRNQPIRDLTGTQAGGASIPPGTSAAAAVTPQAIAPEELIPQQQLPTQVPSIPGADTRGFEFTDPQAAPTVVPSQQYSGQQVVADVGQVSGAELTQPITQIDPAQQAEAVQAQAAQAEAAQVQAPPDRQLDNAELIEAAKLTDIGGPAEAVAQTIETPEEATVQFQLTQLMQKFEGGALPAFAAPAIRKANADMAQRGLSASSMAGQAILQAAMESSIPIALQDAQVNAQFAQSNLSNKQQAAIVNAQMRAQLQGQELNNIQTARVANASRVSEINNMNFTADQQIAMENANLSQGMRLSNLNNEQQTALQNALTIAQKDTANLNNRQTAAVENARNLLNTDLTLLSNRQQAQTLTFQAKQQALLSDQAAVNASRQFNASSQNQVEQFFQSLGSQVANNNINRQQAQREFIYNQGVAIDSFNSKLVDARDKFNTEMALQVQQSNAAWRRSINTRNNEMYNRAAEIDVQRKYGLTAAAQANLWQQYRDEASHALYQTENQNQRNHQLVVAAMDRDFQQSMYDQRVSDQTLAAVGNVVYRDVISGLLTGEGGNKGIGNTVMGWLGGGAEALSQGADWFGDQIAGPWYDDDFGADVFGPGEEWIE